MPQATVINAGTPLSPGASAPLWTDACDSSSNLINTPAPAPLTIPLSDFIGGGNRLLEFGVTAADQIDSIVISGTVKGKLNDVIGLILRHETYGAIPILTNHAIAGVFTTPYPLLGDTRVFNFGETIPTGYVFQSITGPSSSQSIILPEGQAPTDYYYYYTGAGYQWQVSGITPGAAPYLITVPAHRYPYAPTYNYNNVPYFGLTTEDVAPIIFRGFRYRLVSPTGGDPVLVQTKTFQHFLIDTQDTNFTVDQSVTGFESWNDFNSEDLTSGPSNSSFTEWLWSNYGAHFWQTINTTRKLTRTTTAFDGGIITTEIEYDLITVQFFAYPSIQWSVEALAQVAWEAVLPPSALYQFYPPDYADFENYSERSEPLSLTALDFKGKAADGVWTLEIDSTSVPLPVSSQTGGVLPFSPSVVPGRVQIFGLQVTINFKTNEPYLANPVTPTTPSPGCIQAYGQGNLRLNLDDRAFTGILCGINGSSSMGILCGYSIQRIGRTGMVYNVSYFIATVCSMNNVNSVRNRTAISYWAQDWSDRAFSTKGDLGQAFVLGAYQHRIYPIVGQIGLRVQISGNKLTFHLTGQYPALVFIDPTVSLVNLFTLYSLNS
jgi:hypothetical protein